MPHEPYLSYSADPAVAVGHATHAGQSGKNNEDLYALFQTRYDGDDGFGARNALVLAVADGIGGSVAGELASDLAIQAVAAAFRDTRRPIPQRLDAAIRRANADIYHQSTENAALAGMGTTIVAAIVGSDQVQIGHVGDSRAYLLRGGVLYLLTQDHSWAQEAVDAGRLTPEAARVHPNRHVIKRFLGGAPDVEIDYRLLPPANGATSGAANGAPKPAPAPHTSGNGTATQPMAPRPPARPLLNESLDFLPGDTLLLCSDGLSDVVAHDTMRDILKRHDPQHAADKLVAEANRGGGPDNITVVVARKAGGALPMAARKRPPIWAGALLLALLAGAGGGAAFLIANGREAAPTESAALPESVALAAAPTDALAAAPPTETPTQTPVARATAAGVLTPTATIAPAVAVTTTVPPTAGAELSATAGMTESAAPEAASATAPEAAPTATATPAPFTPTPTLPPNTTATPTPRPKSTLAVTNTPTPSPTPTPTPTPSPTPPPSATPTVTPTSRAPTPTNTRAAPLLVSTTTPTGTPTAAPPGAPPDALTSAPPASSGGPTLLEPRSPPNGETFAVGTSVAFDFRLDAELAAGQSLRLVIWHAGESPGDRWYAATNSTAVAPSLAPATYQWGLQVVGEGGVPVRLLPSDRTFVVQPPRDADQVDDEEDNDDDDDDDDDDGTDPGVGPPPGTSKEAPGVAGSGSDALAKEVCCEKTVSGSCSGCVVDDCLVQPSVGAAAECDWADALDAGGGDAADSDADEYVDADADAYADKHVDKHIDKHPD